MRYETTVTSKGTITIAAPLRKTFRIRAGQKLHIGSNDRNELVITPSTDMTSFAAKRARIAQKIPKHKRGLSGDELRKAAAQAWTQKAR